MLRHFIAIFAAFFIDADYADISMPRLIFRCRHAVRAALCFRFAVDAFYALARRAGGAHYAASIIYAGFDACRRFIIFRYYLFAIIAADYSFFTLISIRRRHDAAIIDAAFAFDYFRWLIDDADTPFLSLVTPIFSLISSLFRHLFLLRYYFHFRCRCRHPTLYATLAASHFFDISFFIHFHYVITFFAAFDAFAIRQQNR
jgi:hypothetical protein